MWIVWGLRALVVLAFPAVFILTWLHPGLGLDATGTAAPVVVGSTFVLMKKIGPLHQCPGRHTTRTALRAAVNENRHRLDQYDCLWRELGVTDPPRGGRKRDLKLIHGGDSSPGRRVS
jgi:hypothetical protein